MYFFTKVEVILGAAIRKNDWIIGIAIWYAILVVIRLYLEFIYFKGADFGLFYTKEPVGTNTETKSIEEKLNKGYLIEDIIKSHPTVVWVFYNDYIYDLTKFHHLGGDGLIH